MVLLRTIGRKLLAIWYSLVGLAGFVVALVLLVLIPFALWRTYQYHFGFDQQEWLETATGLNTGTINPQHNPRERMVKDVMAHHLKPGMSAAAVKALLGPPDGYIVHDFMYMVGWSFLDPDCLVVTFSAKGQVVEARVENR